LIRPAEHSNGSAFRNSCPSLQPHHQHYKPENKAMTMLTHTTRSIDLGKPLIWFENFAHFVTRHYRVWTNERARRANLRFVMSLDPIVLRDLGYTREEIAARHDGPLPITRWKSTKPID
jgi:outer membrane phospholipase A